MRMLLATSVVLASLDQNEPAYEPCSQLLLRGEHGIYVHAIAEIFSMLTGGADKKNQCRHRGSAAARERAALGRSITLTEREIIAGLADAKSRGVRGGTVYDYLHLVAAKKAAVEAAVQAVATLNVRHFQALTLPGDPRIEAPA